MYTSILYVYMYISVKLWRSARYSLIHYDKWIQNFYRSLSRLSPKDRHNAIDVVSVPEIKKLKLQCREIAVLSDIPLIFFRFFHYIFPR